LSAQEFGGAGYAAGTVTLVFTDIEGSTSLLQALGDRYPEMLAEHHRLIRQAFARHGAIERGSAGDGLYFVFPAARAAVQAAIDGQLAIAGQAWPDGIAIRDRMGLHTGEPWNTAEGYAGLGGADLRSGSRRIVWRPAARRR
jgi:class 3 adenylate cyclase